MKFEPDNRIEDTEERELELLVRVKQAVVVTLGRVADAQQAGARLCDGVVESSQMEMLMLDGYRRALAYRRAEIAAAKAVAE